MSGTAAVLLMYSKVGNMEEEYRHFTYILHHIIYIYIRSIQSSSSSVYKKRISQDCLLAGAVC